MARPRPQNLRKAVVEHQGAISVIALDGDGDRLIMVDAEGKLYDGDQLLYIIAKHRQALGKMQGGVVGTLMTNLAFEHAMQKLGIPFARAKVGDRYVMEVLQEKKWQLGGENSGHIICLDKHSTGDGIVSALQVLCALRMKQQTLAQAASDLHMYPQVLINVKVTGKAAELLERRLVKSEVAKVERVLEWQRARAVASVRDRAVVAGDGGGGGWGAGEDVGGEDCGGGEGSGGVTLSLSGVARRC